MKKQYKFISGEDPTDEQLNELMESVLVDVKERSYIAENKEKLLRILYKKELQKRFENIQFLND